MSNLPENLLSKKVQNLALTAECPQRYSKVWSYNFGHNNFEPYNVLVHVRYITSKTSCRPPEGLGT